MKRSELKEIIKSSMMEEMSESPSTNDVPQIIMNLTQARDLFEKNIGIENMDVEDASQVLDGMIGELKEIGKFEVFNDDLYEAKKEEEEEEEDIEVEEEDVEEEDVDIEAEEEVEMATPESKDDVQDSLEAALKAAKEMGDQKLIDQIGNTITFFTRTHVVKDTDSVEETNLNEENIGLADLEEMGYEAGEKAAYTYGAMVMKLRNRPDKLAYNKGFMQGVRDELGSSLDEGTETNLNESYNRMQKLAGIIK